MKTTVESQQQQQQGRKFQSPLVQANIQLHDKQIQENPAPRERKTPHEECCGYCDLFCQEKLTATRLHEIEAWTKTVNNNMAALMQKPKAKPKRPKQPRIQYLKYLPPGAADKEEGFHWIQTTSNKPQTSGGSSRSTKDSGNTLLVASLSSGETSRLSSRGVQSDSVLDTSAASVDSCHYSSRSSSNELLNVITIDDALTQNRAQYLKGDASGHPRKRVTSSNSSSMARIPEDQIQERLDSIAKFRSSSSHLNHESDGPLSRAMRTISETRHVLNNNAHHEFLKDQQSGGSHYLLARKAESKRFRRLNDNLRRTIETEHVANSKLRQKVQNWVTASNTDVASSRHSNSEQRPMAGGHCRRPGTGLRSKTTLSARKRVDTADSNHRERLLEMIMQIDEDLQPE